MNTNNRLVSNYYLSSKLTAAHNVDVSPDDVLQLMLLAGHQPIHTETLYDSTLRHFWRRLQAVDMYATVFLPLARKKDSFRELPDE